MEAVGAGASVLAFVTLAIQSTKAISVVLSGIKDAPDNVRRTAQTIFTLQYALEQLAQGQQVPQGLESQVKACSDDLAAFSTTLGKLQTLPADGRGRRAWKRVKAVLDEKTLDNMVAIMAAHSSALGLSIQSAQMSDPSVPPRV